MKLQMKNYKTKVAYKPVIDLTVFIFINENYLSDFRVERIFDYMMVHLGFIYVELCATVG